MGVSVAVGAGGAVCVGVGVDVLGARVAEGGEICSVGTDGIGVGDVWELAGRLQAAMRR